MAIANNNNNNNNNGTHANETQTQLEVLRLRALTEYSVQVLAVTVHPQSGAVSFKGSNILTVNTVEGGKYWS